MTEQAHRLSDSGWERSSGALWMRCACGWEDRSYPDPGDFASSRTAEAAQIEHFRLHLRKGGA